MKKIILILISIAIIIGVIIWWKWPEKEKVDLYAECSTQKCREDVAFIEKAYQKQWDDYYEELNKEEIFEEKGFKCVRKGFEMRCSFEGKVKLEEAFNEFMDVRNGGFSVATTSVPFPPDFNFQMRNIAGWSPKENCRDFLIFSYCLSTYEERVAEMREYFENLN